MNTRQVWELNEQNRPVRLVTIASEPKKKIVVRAWVIGLLYVALIFALLVVCKAVFF